MNLHQARVVLRPRSVSELADLVPRFVAAHVGFFARALAPLVAVTWVGAWAARRFVGGGWGIPWLWALVVDYLGVALFTVGASELLFRPPSELRLSALARRTARALPLLFLTDLRRLFMAVLSACTVVLLPRTLGRGLYAREAVLLEGARTSAAASRGASLARYHEGRCFWLFAGTLLLPGLVSVMAELLGTAVVETVLQLGRPLDSLFQQGGSYFALTGLMLAGPYVASLRFLGYIDMRTRKEGWDIQLRFLAWKEATHDGRGTRSDLGAPTGVHRLAGASEGAP